MENDKQKDGAFNRDKTTTIIALGLLITFIAAIIALFFVNIFVFKLTIMGSDGKEADPEFRKGWFELLKNCLILLRNDDIITPAI